MNTTFSAPNTQAAPAEHAAGLPETISEVLWRNLEPNCGEGPLWCLEQTTDSIAHLMEFMTEFYEMPASAALRLEQALAHLRIAELHLLDAPKHCG